MGNSLKPHLENAQKTGVLQLCSKKITEVPPELQKLVKVLRTLDLSDNKLPSLPRYLGEFAHIKHLTLAKNRIRELPQEIGNLKRMEQFNASDNMLCALPAAFSQLSGLRVLALSGNHLTSFPPELMSLARLEVLDLSRNKICEVPNGIQQIQATEINLNQNQVSVISPDVVHCNHLKILRLEENCLQLQSIPSVLLNDSQVSLLTLEGNLFEMKDLRDVEGYEKYMERYTATKKKMY